MRSVPCGTTGLLLDSMVSIPAIIAKPAEIARAFTDF